MRIIIKILKEWTLPVAMVFGIAGYRWFGALSSLIPALIFMMLLLTFCKLDLARLRPTKLHLWLLLIEIVGSVGLFYALVLFDRTVAQAVALCVIAPTATAASVVAGKLRGNVGMVASFTLFANFAVTIAVPLFFPLMSEKQADVAFWQTFFYIVKKIVPLVICPFLLALVLRKWLPKLNTRLISVNGVAFYLWALALVIVIAQTVQRMVETPFEGYVMCWIAVGSLIICLLQFLLGWRIGKHYGERVAGGQALGQKNSILAIWMAHAYLHPLAALGPGFYVLWQNIINSWQLYRQRQEQHNNSK
ncbi:MAG: transporter [Prevotellaceae bacterium]|nr:transporter [Prevotellaceae bacterium]